jgi:Flp pilus assembly pilin Flp
MTKIANIARNFLRDEEGATMVEYALIVAAIALVVVVGARPSVPRRRVGSPPCPASSPEAPAPTRRGCVGPGRALEV